MGWVRIEDRYPRHPKMMMAGEAGVALDVSGLCYCREHATGGFIPEAAISTLGPVKNPRRAAALLVKVGRWERDDELGGWWIHDFAEFNPETDPDELAAERRREKARAAATARWSKLARDPRPAASADAPSNAQASAEHHAPGVPGDASHARKRATHAHASTPTSPPNPYRSSSSSSSLTSVPSTPEEEDPRFDQAVTLIVDWRRDHRSPDREPIVVANGWRRSVTADVTAEHGTRLRSYLEQHPEASPLDAATAVDPQLAPTGSATPIGCDDCVSGWLLADDDAVLPCPTCRPAEVTA